MNPQGLTSIKEPLAKLLAQVPQTNHPLIGHAYHLANASHEGQHRDEGQPFITHPIAVALILASELGFARDTDMISAALLHDAAEDSVLTPDEDILPTFGARVTELVKGVTKVDEPSTRSRSARRSATLQRLFTAAHRDPRVLILKLADRVHNMRSIAGIKDIKRQHRIAQETVDVYAPLSRLLGMDRIRRELEDRSFGCLHPRVYEQLVHLMQDGPPQSYLDFQTEMRNIVTRNGVRTRIRLQSKSLRSIYGKATGAGSGESSFPVENVHDRYTVIVITSNRYTCYRTLGLIHHRFTPLMDGIKDFIALPKRNGYQALQTTVIYQGQRFEVAIQTPSMYRMSELGVATLRGGQLQEERRTRWLQELAEWHEHGGSGVHFLDEVKRMLFVHEMAVFTPNGDPIILPEGATLTDFAFAVHTDLGLHCIGGRINGRSASRFSVLNWGDTIDIETAPHHQTKRSWLRYVKTYRARRLIRRHITRAESSGEQIIK